MGSEECNVIDVYGRDTLNDNGERLLWLFANHGLVLLKTFFSTAKNAISHTFNGQGNKCIDNILTRQRDKNLVRMLLCTLNHYSYPSRITASSQ